MIRFKKIPNTLFVLFEQVSLSGSTFLIMIFIALKSSLDFSIFSISYSIYLLISGYFRSIIVLPLIYYSASGSRNAIKGWNSAGRLVVLFFVFLLSLTSFAFEVYDSYIWKYSFLNAAMMSFGLLQMELERRRLVSEKRYYTLAVKGMIYFILTLASLCFAYFYDYLSPSFGGLSILASSIATYFLEIIKNKFSFDEIKFNFREQWNEQRRNIISNFFGGTVFSMYNHLVPIMIAIVSNEKYVAVFSASRLVSQPAWVFISGLDTKERSEAAMDLARYGKSALRRNAYRYVFLSLSFSLSIAGILLISTLFPRVHGFFQFHSVGYVEILAWLGYTIIISIAFPLEAITHVSGDNIGVLIRRCIAAVISIVIFFGICEDNAALRGIIAVSTSWVVIMLTNARILSKNE